MPTRTDTASIVVPAPPAAVYAALVSEAARARWLAPAGMTARYDRYDPRPGGVYRLVLAYDDASAAPGKTSAAEDVADGRFVDLVPGERVVEAVDFVSDDPAFAGTMTMTWTLRAVPGGTEVTLVASDVPSGISPADHDVGMRSSLANLASYLRS